MARTKDKTETRKKEILESFQQVISEEGIEGASMGKIAANMGIHPSLIIHYFKNKEEMTVALAEFIFEKYETTFAKKLDEIRNPKQRLDALLNTIFSVDWISLVDTQAFYACYYLCFRNKKVKAEFEKMYQMFKTYLAEEIQLCMNEGVIRRTDPDMYADLIIALVEGLSFYRNISGGPSKYSELGKYLKARALEILTQDVPGS